MWERHLTLQWAMLMTVGVHKSIDHQKGRLGLAGRAEGLQCKIVEMGFEMGCMYLKFRGGKGDQLRWACTICAFKGGGPVTSYLETRKKIWGFRIGGVVM